MNKLRTPSEILNEVSKRGGTHWDAKEIWIQEAIDLGGEGAIYCYSCDFMNTYGYGSTSCSGCNQAYRKLPDGTIEYWI